MFKSSFLSLLILLLCCADLSAQAAVGDDLVIKGPTGTEFSFRPVPLELNEEQRIKSLEYTMGDPELGFKAFPAKVSIGGAFVVQNEWVYYLGKCELTEGQYYAVMNPEAGAEKLASQKPMTGLSYYEAMLFMDKLNTWLFENAIDQLPHLNEAPGFIRLPTEAEWEFAARGGLAVASDVRAAAHPYTDGLENHEWFSGPKSSHNQVQAVGKLAPNPLGLHDMLGNVSEMTNNLYQLEYYQGRSGGLAARGGHFLSNENDLNAALRIEEPFYLGDKTRGMKPNKKPTLGLRLALASPIMTDRDEIAALEDAWEVYRESDRAASPAGRSTEAIGVRTDVAAGDARGHLANAKARLAASDDTAFTEPISRDLGFLEASLTDIDLIRRKGESDSASSWVRIGVFVAQNYANDKARSEAMRKIIINRKEASANEATIKGFEAQRAELEANLSEFLALYHTSLTQLGTLDTLVVAETLQKHRNDLGKRPGLPERAIKACDLFARHYESIKADKVLNRNTLSQDLGSLIE